jgi:hypothetical protein
MVQRLWEEEDVFSKRKFRPQMQSESKGKLDASTDTSDASNTIGCIDSVHIL